MYDLSTLNYDGPSIVPLKRRIRKESNLFLERTSKSLQQ